MKKLTPLAVLLSVTCLHTFAQDDKKPKDAQTVSIVAPAKIKVDGNLSEWDDNLEAYNKNTKLYYTMANDDKYLYLAIKSTDATNNTKITAGGITLAINTANKKKDKDAYTVTFPYVAPPQRGQRGAGGFAGLGGAGGRGAAGGFNRGQRTQPDSASIAQAHAQTIAQAKVIQVFGFKDITDTTVSIYNEYGIKAAINYDKAGNYIYEAAIPLKLMDLSIDNPKEFSYNIKVNGRQLPNFDRQDGGGNFGAGGGGGNFGAGGGGGGFNGGGRGGAGGGGRGGAGGGGGGNFAGGGRGPGGPGGIDFAELTTPSDFWGKYTLAKK